jgi:hypothetical protein
MMMDVLRTVALVQGQVILLQVMSLLLLREAKAFVEEVPLFSLSSTPTPIRKKKTSASAWGISRGMAERPRLDCSQLAGGGGRAVAGQVSSSIASSTT